MLDPATMEAASLRYDAAADEVALLGRQPAMLVDGSSWTCCAADRCRDEAWQVSGAADAVSAQLHEVASDLRSLAALRRAEIATAETNVRSYLAVCESNGVTPTVGFGAIALPPSGDVGWIDVARELGLGV
jgi:hypothetical protein